MDFPTTILELIKQRFEETNGSRPMGGCASPTKAEYYVMRLEDNLVEPMADTHRKEFALGTGIELDGKMKALRSSSAMTFNLFGNHRVRVRESDIAGILAPGDYEVEYEYQLPILDRNPNPANLDARLVSADGGTEIYCEMKLAEWMLGWMKMLRVSYLDPARYLIPEDEARVFIDCFLRLVAGEPNRKGSRKTSFARYDALQMAKHVLALYTQARAGRTAATVRLLNCVWEVADAARLGCYEDKYREMLAVEHEEFERFKREIAPALELFDAQGIAFSLDYLPVAALIEALDRPPAQKQALARYLV